MKAFPAILVAAIVAAGCAGAPTASQSEVPTPATPEKPGVTKVKGPNGFELTKVITPLVTEEQAIEAAKARLQSDKVEEISAELKTLQWASENLAYGESLYTADSPVWIVSVTGELAGAPGMTDDGKEVPHNFSNGKLVVATDTPLVVKLYLFNGEFVPQAIEPGNTGSRIVTTNPSPSPRVEE